MSTPQDVEANLNEETGLIEYTEVSANKGRKVAKPKPQITDLIDEELQLPEEFAHLCSARDDKGGKKEGVIRFLLNREVMDVYRDIIDELEMSRELPDDAHPANINIADEVVMFLIQHDPEIRSLPQEAQAQAARIKASGWYKKQKQQVESDAMFVAISMYNELNVVPVPYKEGEVAFRIGATEGRQRDLPDWMKPRINYEIPLPERKLSNDFERRLKSLNQLVDACGPLWSMQFRNVYERGLTKVIGLVEPRDDAGFPAESSGAKVHAKSSTKSKNAVGESGS